MNAILRKELFEWFNAGATGRWGRYEFLVGIAISGVLCPLVVPIKFAASMLFTVAAFLPVMVTAMAMADSIAGERERGTLQTLFLLPLSDAELLFGKVFAAMIYAMVLCVGSLAAGSVVLALRGIAQLSIVDYASAIGSCIGLGLFVSMVAALIALGNVTARQAQTFVFFPFYVIIIVGVILNKAFAYLPPSIREAISRFMDSSPLNVAIVAGPILIALTAGLVWLCLHRVSTARCAN